MAKIYSKRITQCSGCLHLIDSPYDYTLCSPTGKKVLNRGIIQPWCPLPDETVYDVLDTDGTGIVKIGTAVFRKARVEHEERPEWAI